MNVVVIQQIGREHKTSCTRCQWPAFQLYVQVPPDAPYSEGEAIYEKLGGLCEDCLNDALKEKESEA